MAKRSARVDLRGADAEVLQIVALQSGDATRITRVLDSRNPISATILPHVIALLGSRTGAGPALEALQRAAETHTGALIDALLDPSRAAAVRRRVACVLSACPSQRAVDGLLLGLDDDAADVRAQCARSVFRIRRSTPGVHIDGGRILEQVRTELTRTAPDMRHVFTLLSFVFPMEPLRAAYRGLRSGDAHVRGTAREYLHGILPPDIRVLLLEKRENTR